MARHWSESEMHVSRLGEGRDHAFQELVNYHYRSTQNVIFVVGTGTFVLSISFIGNIDSVLHWPWVLIMSWILLAASIVAKIYSHSLGADISSRAQILLRDYILNGFSTPTVNIYTVGNDDELIQTWHRRRIYVDKITLILLSFGIAALLIFAAANLLGQNDVRKFNELREAAKQTAVDQPLQNNLVQAPRMPNTGFEPNY